MMKNGVYFIVIALLVAELFNILIYANVVVGEREGGRVKGEGEGQIQARICYDLWVFATAANTHFSFYGYLLP